MSHSDLTQHVIYRDAENGRYLDTIRSWAEIGVHAENLFALYQKARTNAYLLDVAQVEEILGQLNADLESAETIDVDLGKEVHQHMLRVMRHTELMAKRSSTSTGCPDLIEECASRMHRIANMATTQISHLVSQR